MTYPPCQAQGCQLPQIGGDPEPYYGDWRYCADHAGTCHNCCRPDCTRRLGRQVYRGNPSDNLYELPEPEWFCNTEDYLAERREKGRLIEIMFAEPVHEAAGELALSTGLERHHPHVIEQIARETGLSENIVRDIVAPAPTLVARTLDELRSLSEDDGDLWVVDDVIPTGVVSVIAGKSKAGKSRLAMEIARAVATGGAFLDEHPAREGRVVVLHGDDSDAALRRLFVDWADRFDLPSASVRLVANPELDLMTPDGPREVRKRLETSRKRGLPIPLLIIDSLYSFTPTMDDSDRSHAKQVMSTLNGLAKDGIVSAVLVVDHSAKAGSAESGADAVIGSQAKGGMSRSGINVEVVSKRLNGDGDEVQVTRLVRWGNAGPGWVREYEHHAPTFTWTRTDGQNDPGPALREQAAELLTGAGGMMTLKALGDALGHPDTHRPGNAVRRALEAELDRFSVSQPVPRRPWEVRLV